MFSCSLLHGKEINFLRLWKLKASSLPEDLWGLGCNTYYRAEMMSGWQEQHLTTTNKVDGTLKNRERKQQTLLTAKMTRNNQLRNATFRCFAPWPKRRRHDELILLKLVHKIFLNETKAKNNCCSRISEFSFCFASWICVLPLTIVLKIPLRFWKM